MKKVLFINWNSIFREIIIILKKKRKKLLCYIISFTCLILAAFILRFYIKNQYNTAINLMNAKEYQDAIDIFEKLGPYEESIEKINISKKAILYNESIQLLHDKKYEAAITNFIELDDYSDSKDKLNVSKYAYAIQLYNNGNYEQAARIFSELPDGYEDSQIYLAKSLLPSIQNVQDDVYNSALNSYNMKNYREALADFESLQEYKDSQQMAQKCLESIRKELGTTISGGILYSMGLQNNGIVVSSGYNNDGQSNFIGWDNIVSVAGFGVVSIGLKSDGTVIITGNVIDSEDVSEWKDIIQIAVGERYIVGLKKDGTLTGAGHDQGDGQLQFKNWENIIYIATGWRHTVGLNVNGDVLITGHGSKSQNEEISDHRDDWTNIIAVAAGGGGAKGRGHTVGLRADGKVVAVGDNSYGQCNVDDWSNIVAIAAGDWHTVGLKDDGTVVATGNDGSPEFETYDNACSVSDWEHIVAIAAGSGYTIGLKDDGSIVTTGYNDQNKRSGTSSWEKIMIYDEWKIMQ